MGVAARGVATTHRGCEAPFSGMVLLAPESGWPSMPCRGSPPLHYLDCVAVSDYCAGAWLVALACCSALPSVLNGRPFRLRFPSRCFPICGAGPTVSLLAVTRRRRCLAPLPHLVGGKRGQTKTREPSNGSANRRPAAASAAVHRRHPPKCSRTALLRGLAETRKVWFGCGPLASAHDRTARTRSPRDDWPRPGRPRPARRESRSAGCRVVSTYRSRQVRCPSSGSLGLRRQRELSA